MKIFITGGTGFIGKALMRKLASDGHSVRALARSENQKNEIQKMGATAVIGDLNDVKGSWLKGIDIVYHIGAIRYEWGYSSQEYGQINVESTKNLLKFADGHNVKKFIFGSTVFVFGTPRKQPIDETFPYAPESEYALSKVEAEKAIRKYEKNSRMSTIIIRPSITYGPEDTRGMLLKLCRLINNGKFITIGNGKNNLHLTYIDDLVQGFIDALTDAAKDGDYIIAGEKPITLNDLAHAISEKLEARIWPGKVPVLFANIAGLIFELIYNTGKALSINFFKNEPIITRSKVNILTGNRTYAIKKAEKELNYHPRTDYPEGLSITINWYRQNGFL